MSGQTLSGITLKYFIFIDPQPLTSLPCPTELVSVALILFTLTSCIPLSPSLKLNKSTLHYFFATPVLCLEKGNYREKDRYDRKRSNEREAGAVGQGKERNGERGRHSTVQGVWREKGGRAKGTEEREYEAGQYRKREKE